MAAGQSESKITMTRAGTCGRRHLPARNACGVPEIVATGSSPPYAAVELSDTATELFAELLPEKLANTV